LVVVSLLLSWCSITSAQDFAAISGRVCDDILHQPIGGVVVTLFPDGISTVTDQEGVYRLERITPGSFSVQFESAFHQRLCLPSRLCRESDALTLDVLLHPLTLTGQAQTVTARGDEAPGFRRYTTEEIRQSNTHDVGAFLDKQGYYVQSDGRSQYVALRGLSPQRTLVLLDGNRLNPNGGAADLSQVPLATVKRIEVYTAGAAARFGADALAGAINIVSTTAGYPDDSRVEITSAWGSHSAMRQELSLRSGAQSGLNALAVYEYAQAKNNYAFTHPYLDKQRRVNNAGRHYSGYLTLSHRRLAPLTLSLRLYNSGNGIPGAVQQETPQAMARRDNRTVSVGYATPWCEIRGIYRELTQEFSDAESVASYDQHYLQVGRQLDVSRDLIYRGWASFSLGAQYLAENFFNDNHLMPALSLRNVARRTAALSGSGKIRCNLAAFSLTPTVAYRLDRIDNRTFISPHVATAASFRTLVDLGVDANYSEAFRLPPIDALFWNDDVFAVGNPDLQPERAINRDLRLSLRSRGRIIIDASATWFANDIDQMIYWRRGFDGKYAPVNLARARVTGREESVGLTMANDRVTIAYHHTAQCPLNKSMLENYYDMTIPFQPERIERLQATLRFRRLKVAYSYSLTGARFIREANTKSLPGYHLHDLTVELTGNLLRTEQVLSVAIYNLGNASYEVLERVPMPGRTVTVGLTIRL
jgi:outer membrane cobalamin receptor